MKKVVIVRNAYRWQYGGAEQFAYNLAYCLRDIGIEPIVVSRVPELLEHCRQARITTFRNLWLKNETHRRWMPLYYILFPLLVAQYIWVIRRADLLIVTSRDDQIFGTIAAKLTHTPVVWFDHADMKHIVARPFRFLSRSYYWALEKADRVVITSKAELKKIDKGLAKYRQANFVVVNNGAMVGVGHPLERRRDQKIVAYIGRLDRDKGIFDLTEAAAKVIQQVPSVQFWLAGKGPDAGELEKKISDLGITGHFKMLGHLENVWDLLFTADIFVYPTHHDASPLAPVEALLAGVPVIATRVGGIPEVVPVTAGILVKPHDPNELAGALIRVLTDSKKLAALRNGTAEAGRELGFATVLQKKYLPIFQRVIEKNS